LIRVVDLVKRFKVHRRPPGLGAALRSIFHRSYEDVRAVDGVTFSIDPGERVGFLGPNGAGKTTTMKVLAGLLHPTEGMVEVGGHEPRKRSREFLRNITLVMGQKNQLIWDLPPLETYELNRAIFDIPRAHYKETLDELVELLELSQVLQKPTRQLSLGERMKCEFVAALLHAPKFLFLDEPTIGLDVSMQVSIREFIRDYNRKHEATVLLTSHYMDDVTALCPRVIIIDHGKVIHDGDLRALVKATDSSKLLSLTLSGPAAQDEIDKLGQLESRDGNLVKLRVSSSDVQHAVSHAMAALPVADLSIEDPPLEEILRQLFRSGSTANTESEKRT
jgi:ABC-2 type transport system ATP-binding protein